VLVEAFSPACEAPPPPAAPQPPGPCEPPGFPWGGLTGGVLPAPTVDSG
jgi:hypothetical protein